MVREKKLKHIVEYENILDEFNVGHFGIKVKESIALYHLNIQITSRWLFIADSDKSYSKNTNNISYTVVYALGNKTSFMRNLLACSWLAVLRVHGKRLCPLFQNQGALVFESKYFA